jgi:hypothetical protein
MHGLIKYACLIVVVIGVGFVSIALMRVHSRAAAYVSIRQHTSAYVSIRQHAFASIALMRVHSRAHIALPNYLMN